MASSSIASLASMFTSLLASDCPTANKTLCPAYNTPARTTQKTPLPTVLLLLHHTDRLQNTASQLLHCCVTNLLPSMCSEPFPSNNCLCWLLSSCLEQICHNILPRASFLACSRKMLLTMGDNLNTSHVWIPLLPFIWNWDSSVGIAMD
jgi:hypothetical protein